MEEIGCALAVTKVTVLLVSLNFLESDFIAKHELSPVLDAAREEGLVILWLYLSSCLYDRTEIRDYQAAHDISKPLDSLTPAKQNAVLADVCKKIESAASPLDGSSDSTGAAPVSPPHSAPISNIPDPNPFFTGRERPQNGLRRNQKCESTQKTRKKISAHLGQLIDHRDFLTATGPHSRQPASHPPVSDRAA
jgi:hypothetical protein